ncbi:MAG: hypothetical protein J5668_00755 [Bacteroidales bacterium]|nr:hypothetical protein [Bacteroidales bacterium]
MNNSKYPVEPNAKAMIESLSSTLMLVPNKALKLGRDTYISAYGVFDYNGRDLLIRVSDHNTFLYRWIENNEGIDLNMSANYAITFVDKVPFASKPNKENTICGDSSVVFTVRQYVYYCNLLTPEEAELVISACVQLAISGVYTDPLEEDDNRHALILRRTSNNPTKDLTSKVRKEHRKKRVT